MKRRFQVWREDGHETFVDAKSAIDLIHRGVLSPEARVVHELDASSDFEAMSLYYKWRGSGIYKPELDADGKPYGEPFKEFDEE